MHERPELILQKLIQFNTTNPPGHEKACINYIKDLLGAYGIVSTIVSRDENRPNLIARLKGEGDAAPLLLYGHVDVVTTENQRWTHDPFAGEIIDGYVWGRGAVDMKGCVAMMIAAFLKAKVEQTQLSGDVLLVILSDEEDGGDDGAKFLVEQHPELFDGVHYALGEFGGFSMELEGVRFYPIMVAEKQMCSLKVTLRGQGGHGSMPVKDGVMNKLAVFLEKLNQPLPIHITPVIMEMIEGIANEMPFPKKQALKQLANPRMTRTILKLLGKQGQLFEALLHHTVAATIIHTSDKVNVIPGEVTVEIDGRILPGFTEEQFLHELKELIKDDEIEIEVTRADITNAKVDMELFDRLATIIKEKDPDGVPIPFVLPGVTDGRFLSSLGIQTYGFTPLRLPPEFDFLKTVHAEDERVPVDALYFGADGIFKALQSFGNK